MFYVLLIVLLALALNYFEVRIDITPSQFILWYSYQNKRKFIILFKKDDYE